MPQPYQALDNCQRCPLAHGRRRNVCRPIGNTKSKVVFVAESPSIEANLCGRTFAGQEAGVIERVFEKLERYPNSYYFTYLVKCLPPVVGVPQHDIIQTCKREWLYREIAKIRPVLVVGIGKFACDALHPKLWDDVTMMTCLPGWAPRRRGYPTVELFAMFHQSKHRDMCFWDRVGLLKDLMHGEGL